MGLFDDIPDAGGGTATVALASTFADPRDLERYQQAIAGGASEQEALSVGDNGVSFYGDDTTNPNDPIVALPPDTPGFAHNRLVEFIGPDGRTGVARVSEKMPATENLKGDASIDLNPAAAALIGHPGGVYPVTWRFLTNDQRTNDGAPDFFSDIPVAAARAIPSGNRGDNLIGGIGDADAYQIDPRTGRMQFVPKGVQVRSNADFGLSTTDYFAGVPTPSSPPSRQPEVAPAPAPKKFHLNPFKANGQIDPDGWLGRLMGSEDVRKSQEELEAGKEPVMPIAKDVRAPGAMQLAKLMDTALGAIDKDLIDQTGGMQKLVEESTREETIEDQILPMIPQQKTTGKQIAAGAANIPIGFANFLLSPQGIATVYGAGLLPRLGQTLMGLGFTGKQVNDFFKAKTLQEKITAGGGALLLAVGTAADARRGRTPETEKATAPPPAPETKVQPAAQPNEPTVTANLPPTDTQIAGATVLAVPTNQIASRPDLMQFKRMDDTATGENVADQITTTYDPLKAGNLLLWEPTNPADYGLTQPERYIVANGHHRNAAATQQGIEQQNAQILQESAGFSTGDARALAAEANIADGKGTIYDAAKFIRERAATHGADEALGRARQIGARGEKAATIALSSGPDLYASFVNEQITPDQTAAIARIAPGNEGLQRLGIQRALQGDVPNELANFLQAVQAKVGRAPEPTQVDLFGSDDAAIKQAEEMAKRAGAIQREIADQINAVAGAARRPEKARALGVDISDPASVNAKLARLQALRERARNWAGDDAIRQATLSADESPGDVIAWLQEQSFGDNPPTVAETEGGTHGNIPGLRGSTRANVAGGTAQTSGRSISQLQEDFATRSKFIKQNREALASYIEAAGTDQALKVAGLTDSRAREYARESLRQYAEQARQGVLPRRPSLPIYRGDFEARRAAYTRASDHAFGTIQQGVRALGFTPPEHLYASGTSGPRLRSGEKGTADLFQSSDQPFNLVGETGIDYSARQVKEAADKKKLEDAAKAQDEAQGRLFAQGAAAPRAPRPPGAIEPAPAAPIVLRDAIHTFHPLRSWWKEKTLGIRKLIGPQTIDDQARLVANIIRDYNGQLANKLDRAHAALDEWRRSFDQTPVPRNWFYEPGKRLPRNYAFIDQSERGGLGLTPNELALKRQLDAIMSESIDDVHRVAPKALKTLIQDYFPHLWRNPEQAKKVFVHLTSTRPLEGTKAFLKKRSLDHFVDGLRTGLRPVSDNPIELFLTKLHEIRKFIAAQEILREAKQIGARKFVYVFEEPPEGWVRVEDPSTNVFAPPFVTVPEAFDEQMRVKTVELLDSLGIPHERLSSLGGKRWGTYQEGGTGIRTKFAGPLSVYFHELGHGLQERYRWIDQILGNVRPESRDPIAVELRNLADLRLGEEPTKSFRKYVRSKDEKAAVMLEAYIHAPEKMREVAPTIFARVRQFIADRPELHPINDLRPSLVMGTAKQQIPVGGLVTLGHYYMPEGAAAVLTNYLSPGLNRFGVIRNLRTFSNVLNAAQLGMSAFHAGFTSIDAVVSTWALGLRYLSEGKIMRGVTRIGVSPLAPVANYFTGKAIQTEMLRPATGEVKILGARYKLSPEGQAAVENYAKLAVQAGLRATTDPFWKTHITRNMIRAWHQGGVRGYAGTVLRLPFAISEQLMRPILEVLVPRQKLGVFAGMARAAMDRLGPEASTDAVRDALARAADATEDRMGQMTYDNMFYNRVIKDAALLGFRAYGWTYGKYRALLGGIGDTIRTPSRIAAGEPILTDRMAYLLALPMVAGTIGSIMNYAMTGEPPQDWRDLFMPRTGRLDANGNPQRISPPTYLKDFLSDWHDAPNLKKMMGSFYHKLNPAISVAVDVLQNSDFNNTKVFNEDDPWLKQQWDKVLFVMRSAEPFSISGAVKLSESRPGLSEYLLPFFGFVPAKIALTMTPAQNRAAELYRDTLPAGARTATQAMRSHLLKRLIRNFKEGDPDATAIMQDAVAKGQLGSGDFKRILSGIRLTPLQYQVERLSVDDAMKVWDLANEKEKVELRSTILKKIGNSRKTESSEKLEHYWRVFTGAQQQPKSASQRLTEWGMNQLAA